MDRILRYFTENSLLVNLIVLFIIIVGVVSSFRIKQEVFPMTDIDTMIITVIYPGASPSDVELNAVIPIERELAKISGIGEYVSFSIENGAIIYAYIDQDLKSKQKVKDEVFRSITKGNVEDLTLDIEEISIRDANPKLMSIYSIGLTPKKNAKVQDRELFDFSRSLEDKLLKVKGVSEIRKSGYLDREIHVEVIPKKMGQFYISLNDIIKSIRTRNIRTTGGTLQSLHKEQTIVTIGQFENPMDVGDVIVRSNFEEQRVNIRDIAKVRDGFKKENVRVKVNRKKAVVFQIVKKENADVVKTIQNVRAFMKRNKSNFPDKFDITVIDDKSLSISSLLDVVLSNAVLGFILVMIVLLIFLDLKTSFWTAFGIPVSLLMVITFMHQYDISVNIISLGAIVLVLGMMVDHAIIISDVIFEEKKTGKDPYESAVIGVKSVIGPVAVTIITTIVAFLPMLAIKGLMGKFVQIFPIIITATLAASFLEAVFILPNHLAHSKTKPSGKKQKQNWYQPVIDSYGRLMLKLLKYRYIVVTSFVFIFVLTILISSSTIKGFVLIWDDSSDAIYVNMEVPERFGLDDTESFTSEVEEIIIKKVPAHERISLLTNIGHHTVKPIHSKGNHENWSQILINLVQKTERKRTAADIIRDLRRDINTEKLKNFKRIVFEERVLGPSPGEAVNIKIVSAKKEVGKKLQGDIELFLTGIHGVKDVDNDQKKGKEELKINFNYNKLAKLGLTVEAVAQTVRAAYEGIVATSVQTTEQKIDFRVKVDDIYHKDKRFLKSLLIPNDQGRLIKLKDIATIITREGSSVINHYNGARVITVIANVDKKIITASQVAGKVKSKFQNLRKKYPDTDLVFGGEAKETKKSMGGLRNAFLIALLLIYFILILLFRSLSQPVIVLLSVPFGLIGVLLAFLAHGIPMSFMGFIGIIGLSGVVVNDSVIMVEFINRVFSESKGKKNDSIIDSITKGAKQRFRPVLLTTLTTVVALLPTVYGIGGDAKSLVPTVMAIAYGLLFATVLTLIFIPTLYMVNSDIKGFLGKRYYNLNNKV